MFPRTTLPARAIQVPLRCSKCKRKLGCAKVDAAGDIDYETFRKVSYRFQSPLNVVDPTTGESALKWLYEIDFLPGEVAGTLDNRIRFAKHRGCTATPVIGELVLNGYVRAALDVGQDGVDVPCA